MSQCSARKRWLTLILFAVATLQTGLITGCSFAELKELATEGSEDSANAPTLRFKRSGEPEVLIPKGIIKGGKPDIKGALGEFTNMLVGGEDLPIRFVKPVAVSGYGDFLYILDGDGPSIYRFNLKNKTLETFGQAGQQFKGEPTNIFVDADLSFYVTDPVGKKVLYFDKSGRFVRHYMDLVNLSRPIDVLVDDLTGNVYVADGSFSHIVIFNKLGTPLRAIGSRGTGPGKFRAITAITKSPSNSLFVADRLELPVQEIGMTPGSAGQFRFALGEGEVVWPTAIAIDKEQRVYVSDKAENTIKIFDDIRLIATVGGTGSAPGRFRLITDMWMSKDQHLYVADSLNRRVQVFEVVPEIKKDDLFILP